VRPTTVFSGIIGGVLLIASSVAGAQELRGQIESIVRDYLASHPDEVGEIVKGYFIQHPEAISKLMVEALKQRSPSNVDTTAARAMRTPLAKQLLPLGRPPRTLVRQARPLPINPL
jgi:hypothetical protein